MQKRRLGQSDIHTAPLVVGGNVFGWTLDETASLRMLDEFVAAGFDFIDTADVYSRFVPGQAGGESETLIGKWLHERGNRDRVVLATKVGMSMGPGKEGLSKSYIFRAIEDSLRRLQTDYIDLYQSHRDDPGTPLEETLGAYAELIRQGKVRFIGASNYTGRDSRRRWTLPSEPVCHAMRACSRYTTYTIARTTNRTSSRYARSGKLGVIPYFSLASGFLTGKYRSLKISKARRAPELSAVT